MLYQSFSRLYKGEICFGTESSNPKASRSLLLKMYAKESLFCKDNKMRLVYKASNDHSPQDGRRSPVMMKE